MDECCLNCKNCIADEEGGCCGIECFEELKQFYELEVTWCTKWEQENNLSS